MNLVTGGTGFLGAHIVAELLRKEEKVRILARNPANTAELYFVLKKELGDHAQVKDNLEIVKGDLLDIFSIEDALEGVKTVYHSAAIVSMESSEKIMMEINGRGTANLVDAILHINSGIRLCHISSIASLGRTSTSEVIDEETHWKDNKSNSSYSKSKYRAEMEVWRGTEEGLNAVILNPGVIIGSGNWEKGTARLFDMVAKGFPFYSEGITGYVDVKDVAEIAVKLAESGIKSERFIIVAENLSYREFFHMVAEATGAKKAAIEIKPWMSRIAWRIFKLISFFTRRPGLITRDSARASQEKHSFSSQKLIDAISYRFTPISETVKRAAMHHKEVKIAM